MKPKSLRHLSHYIVLLLLMVGSLVALIFTSRNILSHTVFLIFITVSYLFWGIVHSAVEKELNSKIVLEYLLLGLLGLTMVLGVLYYL